MEKINRISREIIDAAMKVHSILGSGLLEHAYQVCLAHELQLRGLRVLKEVGMSISYEGTTVDLAYRIDLLVENQVIIELKSVDNVSPVHKAQLLTYLKLSNKPLGLLLNFGEQHLRNGILRLINSPSAIL